MDISFKTEEGRFNYRVGGILIHKDKLLIMKDDNTDYFYIPGGRAKINETSEAAIKREFREEIAVDIKIKRMLWVNEAFFYEEYLKENFHEICFYYLLELCDERLLARGDYFEAFDDIGQKLYFSWVPLCEVKNLNIYPIFLKEKIITLPGSIEQIIEDRYGVL